MNEHKVFYEKLPMVMRSHLGVRKKKKQNASLHCETLERDRIQFYIFIYSPVICTVIIKYWHKRYLFLIFLALLLYIR